MSTEFVCDHCRTQFSCKGNLTKHVNTSKRCINSRNNITPIKCEGPECVYTSTKKALIMQHQYNCQLYIQYKIEQTQTQAAEINSAKDRIKMLEELLEKERNKSIFADKNEPINIPLSTTVNEENINRVYEECSEDLRKIYSSSVDFILFIIHKFLIHNKNLIYRYDEHEQKFVYYSLKNSETDEVEYIKHTEKYCYSLHEFFHEKTSKVCESIELEDLENSKEYTTSFSKEVRNMLFHIGGFSACMKKYLLKYQEFL